MHGAIADDCMDAGGRAMHGAIAENAKFYVLRVLRAFVVNKRILTTISRLIDLIVIPYQGRCSIS